MRISWRARSAPSRSRPEVHQLAAMGMDDAGLVQDVGRLQQPVDDHSVVIRVGLEVDDLGQREMREQASEDGHLAPFRVDLEHVDASGAVFLNEVGGFDEGDVGELLRVVHRGSDRAGDRVDAALVEPCRLGSIEEAEVEGPHGPDMGRVRHEDAERLGAGLEGVDAGVRIGGVEVDAGGADVGADVEDRQHVRHLLEVRIALAREDRLGVGCGPFEIFELSLGLRVSDDGDLLGGSHEPSTHCQGPPAAAGFYPFGLEDHSPSHPAPTSVGSVITRNRGRRRRP